MRRGWRSGSRPRRAHGRARRDHRPEPRRRVRQGARRAPARPRGGRRDARLAGPLPACRAPGRARTGRRRRGAGQRPRARADLVALPARRVLHALPRALAGPFPPEVGYVALYSRSDGIVDWRSCVDPDADVCVEVRGSHCGMGVNADAYRAVATRCLGRFGRGARRAGRRRRLNVRAALEQRDALDVRRLREHVDRADAAERVAGLDELRRVRRQRRRVARDVDDPLRRRLDDPAHDLLGEAGAGRVDHADVGPAGLLDELAHRQADVAGEEARRW